MADEIAVRGYYPITNDTDTTREAGEAIERSVDLPVDAVKATVSDHVVTLSGQVTWQYQREAASRAVRYLRGVTDVVNTVALRPAVSSAHIKTSITAALVRAAQLEGRHTGVANEAGVVTLEGTLDSWSERQPTTHTAWSAPGVTGVLDNMRVST